MTTIAATKARKEFFELVRGAAEAHKTYRIHHRRGSAVLMSEQEYDGLMETLELLSIPGFRQSIKRSLKQAARGQTASMEEVFGADA